MSEFGQLKRVPLRELWKHEGTSFTPWLAANIGALGAALGLELELLEREAAVGDFSLDLLARDLGSSRKVIIENQLTQTDHDHLGKLITYAAGFGASVVVWVAESIRDEHRQALEWLNQRTDEETHFFGVVVEVLVIDDSKPAYNFNPVVIPSEWQKSIKPPSRILSSKGEKYRDYFQKLIDELRTIYKFTNAKVGQPQSWYSFSSGMQGIVFGSSFAQGGKVRVEIYIDKGEHEKNKNFFDMLYKRKAEIENSYGTFLEWERLDERRASRIAIYREGNIDVPECELEEIRQWQINNLIKFKKVFAPEIKQILENGEWLH